MSNSEQPPGKPASARREPVAAARLFREPALAARRYRGFGSVVVVTPPSAPVTLCFALLASACLVATVCVIQVPERARATGVLLPSAGLLKVRAPRAGRVEQLSVANGSAVGRAQPLLLLGDDRHAPARRAETVIGIESLENERRLLDAELGLAVAAAEARARANRQRLRTLGRQLESARREARARTDRAEFEERRAERLVALAGNGLVAGQAADEITAGALAARAESHAARQRVHALEDRIAAVTQQVGEDADRPRLLRMQAGMRREALLREIAGREVESALEVTAPAAGVVAGLAVRAGSRVRAGQVLLTLFDPDARLEARLYVGAENAGMIRLGQRVELRLPAYPEQLFGTLTAEVTSMSGAAIPAREIDAPIPLAGAVFELRAAIAADSMVARGMRWRLPPGTAFEADLIRRRWPLYRWLFASSRADRAQDV